MESVLAFEKPDLVVFSGDQVTSNNIYLNASAFWSLLVTITEEAHIPWVSIFGNHDDQPLDYPASTDIFGVPEGTPAQTDRDTLLQHRGGDRSFRFSMTQSMFTSRAVANSVGYLLINRPPPDAQPAAIIWFLDTGGGSLQQVFDDDQLAWLLQKSREMEEEYSTKLPGIAFLHIPLPEYAHPRQYPEQWKCFGMRQDGVAPVNYSPKNALGALSSAGVQVLSCGHNHGNDECCSRLGEVPVASLCFGRHSGLGRYNHGWDHGARVFLLRDAELPWITTYIRLRNLRQRCQ